MEPFVRGSIDEPHLLGSPTNL